VGPGSGRGGTARGRRSGGRTPAVRARGWAGGRGDPGEVPPDRGVVRNADEEPVANAWVVVDDIGWTVTDKEGKFRFDSLAEWKYKLRVRGPDGGEAEAKFGAPGARLDLTLAPVAKPAKAPAKRKK